jgi:anti-anti-sigma factor
MKPCRPRSPRRRGRPRCDHGVLRITGELDISSAVITATVQRDPSIRVIDLRDVTFIDAAGLGILREVVLRSAPDVVIRNPSPCVRRFLALAELDGELESPTRTVDPGQRGRR